MSNDFRLWTLPEKARAAIWRRCDYGPSAEQRCAHLDASRIKQVSGGERAGKSFWTAQEMHCWLCIGDGLYWIVGPTYELGRPEFLHLVDIGLKSKLIDPDSVSMPKSGSCTLKTYLGGVVTTKSSQDPITLAGVAPRGVCMVEAAQQSYETFLRLRGRVAETRGPLVLSGTFEGSLNWYADLWKAYQGENEDDARSFSLPTWSNLAVFPGGRDDPEIKRLEAMYPVDVFMERFGAIPCTPPTIVFKEFSYTVHVTERAEHTPGNPVQLWVDPGYAGAYAVLAVEISHGQEVYHFDELYYSGKTAQEIIAEAKARSWWGDVKAVVMDVAGRQHPAAESQAEIWYSLTGLRVAMQPVPIVDGILRHRTFLKDPASGRPRLLHHPRCAGTLREYGLYKYAEDSEHRPQTELPVDRDNHCVTGDTLIDMPGGKRRIADLVGQTPWVYCWINGKTAVRRARNIRKTRDQGEVVKLMMDRSEIILTADHPVMLSTGEYVPAGSLQPGQSIMALNRFVTLEGYTRVCMTGQTKRTKAEHRLVYEQVHGPIPRRMEVHHKDGQRWNNHPDNLEALSMEDHASVHHKGQIITEAERERLAEISREAWAADYERRVEIARQNVVAAHAANVGRTPTDETRQKIGKASKRMWESKPELREQQAERCRAREMSLEGREKIRQAKIAYWQSEAGQAHKARLAEANRQRSKAVGENHRVIAVIPWGVADVYNMEVDEAENFVANDIVVHNSMKALAYGLVANFGHVAPARRRSINVRYG